MARVKARQREVAIKEHGSEKPLREMKQKKLSSKALAVLEAGLTSEDKDYAFKCAKMILEHERNLEKDIDSSEISRIILSMKAGTDLTTVPQQSNVVLNFNEINPDFRDIEATDFSEVKAVGE